MENIEINEPLWRRGVSWRGIVAGTLCTLAFGNLLLALGAGVGLVAMSDNAVGQIDYTAAATGGGIWVALAIALSTFFGAWVSVRVSPYVERAESMIQGLVTWAFSFHLGMVAVFLASLVAGLVGPEVAASTTEATGAASSASWWYFITGALAAVAGLLGGLAAFNARVEVPKHPGRREVITETTKAPA